MSWNMTCSIWDCIILIFLIEPSIKVQGYRVLYAVQIIKPWRGNCDFGLCRINQMYWAFSQWTLFINVIGSTRAFPDKSSQNVWKILSPTHLEDLFVGLWFWPGCSRKGVPMFIQQRGTCSCGPAAVLSQQRVSGHGRAICGCSVCIFQGGKLILPHNLKRNKVPSKDRK